MLQSGKGRIYEADGAGVSEPHSYRLSEDSRYWLRVIDQLGIGFALFGWGTVLALKEFGFITKGISTLPYLVITLGMLLVFGGIYRLHARQKTAQV